MVLNRSEQGNQDCNICLSLFEDDDMVRVFPCCDLAQHTECLVEWFKTHDNCIVCRKKISDVLGGNANNANDNTPSEPAERIRGIIDFMPRIHWSDDVQQDDGPGWSDDLD